MRWVNMSGGVYDFSDVNLYTKDNGRCACELEVWYGFYSSAWKLY